MRLNTISPSIITPPEVRPEVGGVAGARAIDPQTTGAAATPPRLAPQPAAAPQTQAPTGERRRLERRGEDRRQRKLSVLLEMRIGQRRASGRRDSDERPASVDVKA